MAEKISVSVLILLVILLIIILFLVGKCGIVCGNKKVQENYKRSCLAQGTCDFHRTPVDYVQKNCKGLMNDPHWIANPANKYQPLELGTVDMWADSRRLNKNNGLLFQEFSQNFPGCGSGPVYLPNDEKTRFDLVNLGDLDYVRELKDMYSPRFGPRSILFDEQMLARPSPFQKLYGGNAYLPFDRVTE